MLIHEWRTVLHYQNHSLMSGKRRISGCRRSQLKYTNQTQDGVKNKKRFIHLKEILPITNKLNVSNYFGMVLLIKLVLVEDLFRLVVLVGGVCWICMVILFDPVVWPGFVGFFRLVSWFHSVGWVSSVTLNPLGFFSVCFVRMVGLGLVTKHSEMISWADAFTHEK